MVEEAESAGLANPGTCRSRHMRQRTIQRLERLKRLNRLNVLNAIRGGDHYLHCTPLSLYGAARCEELH